MKEEFLYNSNKFYEYHNNNQIDNANEHAKRMNLILKDIVNEDSFDTFCDDILLSQNSIAIIWVCGLCIDYNYRRDDAIEILKELSYNEDEIISRDASMLLFVKLRE